MADAGLLAERCEVPDVVGHDHPVLGQRLPEQGQVVQSNVRRRLLNHNDVMAIGPERIGKPVRQVLVQEQPHRAG